MTEIGLLQARRRHRLHQRQDQRRQHARHAQRPALRQGLRRADRPPHRGPLSQRGRRHELGRGGDAARACPACTRRPRPSCSSATCASSRSPAGAITPPRCPARKASTSSAPPRQRQLPVTCGVSDQPPDLNENDIGSYRTFLKLAAAAAGARTTAAPWCAALAAGDIDVIVSSHDPQDADVKRRPFAEAADGAVGLETLLAAALRLYHNGEIGLLPLLEAMTINPAKLLGLPVGPPREGRARRPRPRRPRPALGGGQGAAEVALQELAVRREQDAGPRARAPWLPATPSTNTLSSSAM